MSWKPIEVLKMHGEAVARRIPADGQIVTESWNRAVAVPYVVYVPEQDKLLMLIGMDYPTRPYLMHSFDHGETWSEPRPILSGEEGNANHLLGVSLTYLGGGTVIYHVESGGKPLLWFSYDYGETWQDSVTIPQASNGLPAYQWDPFFVDKDPETGEVTRLVQTGYNGGISDTVLMERALGSAEKVFELPLEWKWKRDSGNRGLDEGWHKLESFDEWPKTMRIDKAWTAQGEPIGLAWYGTTFTMPHSGSTPLFLYFGGIDGLSDIFLDGEKITRQHGPPEQMWNQPFYVELKNGLAPGRHTMAIRVDKDCCQAGIHKPIWVFDQRLREIAVLDDAGMVHPPKVAGDHTVYCFLRFSHDRGHTWSKDVVPPSWKAVEGDEVALCRAANGSIVAAVRLAPSEQVQSGELFKKLGGIDHFEGLGYSVSHDDGYTWSDVTILYDYGRHHPCMVLMPDGTNLMTYVVRLGYPRDENGYPQFGIEAIISRDNGETWDTQNKYVLAKWSGIHKEPYPWWCMSQATSTVLLPDGSLLTAYGSSYRGQPLDPAAGGSALISPRDVGLVRWRSEG